jgi:hypothetical protein
MDSRKSTKTAASEAQSLSSTSADKTPSEVLASIYKRVADKDPTEIPPGLARVLESRKNKG